MFLSRSWKRLGLKSIQPSQTSLLFFTQMSRKLHQQPTTNSISKVALSGNMSPTSLFEYTAGRWLHLDKQQRDARYIEFNIDRLFEKVISLRPSATSVTSCQKIEGGFSKAFIIETDDGRCAVAKLPTSVAGPARHITNSEVATITYLQQKTKIPIPAILDWNDDPANPIGSAYIIMEHAGGVLLQEAWTDMPSDKKVKCIGAICTSILPISELDFPGNDLSSYATALIDSGLARLPPANHPILYQQQASFQGSVHRHLELLKVGQAVFSELLQHSDIRSNAKPTLFHPDLHKRNIFISKDDPTIVTGIIDWQCASVEPAFYYADDVPDFAKVPPEGTLESDERTLCSQAYEVGWALLAPRLGATRKIDEILLRPFRYCHRTWRDGFVPFTHELIQLRDAWKELGFEKDCPVPPLSPEEMSFYKEQLGIYDGLLEFRQDMVETLGVEGDGWVSEDRWEGVKKAHQYFYETIMAAMENDKDREELRTMWPFDQCQPRNRPGSFHCQS
ncbi:hypothetical protein ACJ73_08543 [Blastomyces percursus]|uniref:Altered inheritance of mitochondria protein 9, mitochondrial n=1 Tax=Blastomyces percursus TaxID=1658174 RepID=A0A1J9QW90_9EURO|nr:hypothetical protein ACJ73_08543 [Blastomyces percursus]